jgi:hypothetical protein
MVCVAILVNSIECDFKVLLLLEIIKQHVS